MDWLQRIDIILLALMLVHIVVVLLYVSHRYRLAYREEGTCADSLAFQRDRRKLVAKLNIKVSTLNSIAFVAPYLGLAGTCIGIGTGLRGVGIEAESALAAVILGNVVPIALITTISGLLVAIPAVVSYNYLRTRIEMLEGRAHRGVRQKFPLATRLSKISFPILAAPFLAVLTGLVFWEYSSYETPTGLSVGITAHNCESDVSDRLVVLHVSNEGKLFLNQEPVEWNNLAERLSDIYRLRAHRTIYLTADDAISFQTVADAIGVAAGALATQSGNSQRITVRLLTPAALKSECPEPRLYRSGT